MNNKNRCLLLSLFLSMVIGDLFAAGLYGELEGERGYVRKKCAGEMALFGAHRELPISGFIDSGSIDDKEQEEKMIEACMNSMSVRPDNAHKNQDTLTRTKPIKYDKKLFSKEQVIDTDYDHPNGFNECSIALSPINNAIAVTVGNNIHIYDMTIAGLPVKRILRGHTHFVTSVVFSPDGTYLASGSFDKSIGIWKVETGICEQRLIGHTDTVFSVAFSPDGNFIASGSEDHTIGIWDRRTSAQVKKLEGHTRCVRSVAFSPNGVFIASGSEDKTVGVWNVLTGDRLSVLEGHSYVVTSVAFSFNGNYIASGSGDCTVRIWDVDTDQCVRILKQDYAINAVAFSPDGNYIASGSYDRMVYRWDIKTGKCINVLKGHFESINSVAFSSDGTTIASGAGDGMVRIWDISRVVLEANSFVV